MEAGLVSGEVGVTNLGFKTYFNMLDWFRFLVFDIEYLRSLEAFVVLTLFLNEGEVYYFAANLQRASFERSGHERRILRIIELGWTQETFCICLAPILSHIT